MSSIMRIYVFFLLTILSSESFAQQEALRYFKDWFLTQPVEEARAKYKQVETMDSLGRQSITVFNLKKNCLMKTECYKKGKPNGRWQFFGPQCDLLWELVYSDNPIDTLFTNNCEPVCPEGYEKAFYGENEMGVLHYAASKMIYPDEAKTQGIMGTVYIELVIDPQGKVEVASILQSAHPLLDRASWDIFKDMPNWTPAKKNGMPIYSVYVVPTQYRLN